MSHELYIQVLSAMFLFWNGARILTYLPTIGKLLAKEADLRSHSLLSWGSWAISNGTFALMLLEMSRGVPNGMFWMNLANTLMCVIVSGIILFRRFPRLHTDVCKVHRKITRNESKAGAVSGQPGLLHQGARSLAVGANLAGDPVPAAPPARFGRPELWVAWASALVFGVVGVVGAVTYDIWPTHHDQSAYVESKASTQQVHGTIEPALPTQQLSSSGPVTPSTPPRARATALAPPTPSTSFERRAAPSRGSAAAPRPATGQSRKASNGARQNRGNWASHFMASVRQAFGMTRSTPPKRQMSSPGRGAPSSSASSRGTAVSRAEITRHAPSAPFDHGAAPSRDFAAPPFAAGRPGRAGDFATRDRLPPAQPVPVYEAPSTIVFDTAPVVVYEEPPVVYQEPPVMYAQAPETYGHGYAGEYREGRQWHDKGWHKGWKRRRHEEDDD